LKGAPGDVHVSNDLGRLLNVTDKLAQQRKRQVHLQRAVRCSRRFEDRATCWRGC
jgi:hypothetical protein